MIEHTEHGMFIPRADSDPEGIPMARGVYYDAHRPARPNVGDYDNGIRSITEAEELLRHAARIVRWHREDDERRRQETAAAEADQIARLAQVIEQNVSANLRATFEQVGDAGFIGRLAYELRADPRVKITVKPEDES